MNKNNLTQKVRSTFANIAKESGCKNYIGLNCYSSPNKKIFLNKFTQNSPNTGIMNITFIEIIKNEQGKKEKLVEKHDLKVNLETRSLIE